MTAGLLARARKALGKLRATFGLGPSAGVAPPAASLPGCMHIEVGDAAVMSIALGDSAAMDIELGDAAVMTIEIGDC